ncbi:hypothetical protein PSP6_690112 [Paraburkholderia tropica]|nr:hypothetical protein PSP6_690112 [Paraburkholderia tropica]
MRESEASCPIGLIRNSGVTGSGNYSVKEMLVAGQGHSFIGSDFFKRTHMDYPIFRPISLSRDQSRPTLASKRLYLRSTTSS